MKILPIRLVLYLVSSVVVTHVKGFTFQSSLKVTAVAATEGGHHHTTTSITETNEPQQQLEWEEYDYSAKYTGTKRRIDWPASGQPIPLHAEIALLKSGVLSRRGEFTLLTGARVDEIASKCEEFGMAQAQGMIVRKQYLVSNVVKRTNRFLAVGSKSFDTILRKFSQQERTIQELSWDVDLPPVSIIRAILRNRVDEGNLRTIRDWSRTLLVDRPRRTTYVDSY